MNSVARHAPDFWRGKRVLLTGHTGFKGAWLTFWLHRLGADVTGVSLAPATTPSLFSLLQAEHLCRHHECDIRDASRLVSLVATCKPEIVFHLAAQPLVRASYRDPLNTFSTNVQGTANVLDALRGLDSVRTVVAITTDKVYKNLEQAYPYRETDELGGHDPYSASKAAAEIIVASYRDAYLKDQGVAVATARAGNVIGGGDWSEDRLIPDAVRAWESGSALHVRRPQAIRPWQHVLEPLYGYVQLAQQMWHQPALAGAYNFGPQTQHAATVGEVVKLAQRAYGKGDVTWGDGTEGPHEAGWLALEIAKSRTQLGLHPCWDVATSVTRTMQWYALHHQGRDIRACCEQEITAYEAAYEAADKDAQHESL